MTELQQEERKNKRIAALTSLGVHAVTFLLCFFLVAWRPPNPPLGSYGIELNFGLDDQGYGDVQPETPVGSGGTQAEEPEQPEEKPEEKSQPEEAKPVEPEPVEQEEVVSKVESPVTVAVKEEKKKEEKPDKPVEKVTEPKKEVVTQPKEDPKAVYKPAAQKTESSNKTTEGKAGAPGNHGDDEGKVGDKGNPEGSLDAKALYGKQGGGGGGPSLELSGWAWDERPAPNVPNNESGRVVFEIKVDENGDIISVRTLERSVSAEAEQICKNAVQKLTFTKTGSNVPPISTGKITFLIRAR